MRTLLIGLLVLAVCTMPVSVLAQGADLPSITSPTADQVLRGPVAITGTTSLPNFASAELSFAYASDSTNTWFSILTTSESVTDNLIATWDTTSISDGDYILRLRVNLQDGTLRETTVAVQVRNYTALPTPTPTLTPTTQPAVQIPTPILVIVAPSATSTTPAISTPTPLPANPAEITQGEIYKNLQRGALIIAGIFIFLGILLRLRRS